MDALARVLGEVREAVYVLDGEGRVVFHNGRLPPGVEPSEAEDFNGRVPPALRLEFPLLGTVARTDRLVYTDAMHHRHTVRRRVFPVDGAWACLFWPEGDPSEATRLELLGRLVQHVAHDLNNMLTAIVGHADLLAQSGPDDAPDRDWHANLRLASRQASRFAHRLMAFAQGGAAHPQVIELNEHTAELTRMIQRMVPAPSGVDFRPAKGEVHARVDPHRLDQALLALALGLADILVPGARLRFTVTTDPAIEIEASALRDPALDPSFDGFDFARMRVNVSRPDPLRFVIDLREREGR